MDHPSIFNSHLLLKAGLWRVRPSRSQLSQSEFREIHRRVHHRVTHKGKQLVTTDAHEQSRVSSLPYVDVSGQFGVAGEFWGKRMQT